MAKGENYAYMAASPRTSASADDETMLMGDSSIDRSVSSQKSRSNFMVLALSISNAISVLILLLVVIHQLRPGATRCEEPTEVFYPTKPDWFPPESKETVESNLLRKIDVDITLSLQFR